MNNGHKAIRSRLLLSCLDKSYSYNYQNIVPRYSNIEIKDENFLFTMEFQAVSYSLIHGLGVTHARFFKIR